MNETQQIREAAMRLAIQSCRERAKSMLQLVEMAECFEHYLRTGQLPKLPDGQHW